jgi:hypothetical protein
MKVRKRPASGWRETAMEKDGAASLGLFSKAMGKAFFISVAGGRSEPDSVSRRCISFPSKPGNTSSLLLKAFLFKTQDPVG